MADASDTMIAALMRNAPYVKPGDHQYDTNLGLAEPDFRYWVAQNKVPFDPKAGVTDYDMRGFYQALAQGDPRAQTAQNPNDKQLHFPDYWKTPNHETFSSESQWAGPTAPQWNPQDQLISPGGRILTDERNKAPQFGAFLSALKGQP
jgi:hypothetical protein